MEYRKFNLTPGQQAPEGSTGISMPDGYIVWVGDNWIYNEIINHIMSQEELDEYNLLLEYMKLPAGADQFISFDQFKDPDLFAARKEELKTIIDSLIRS